jgi:hydrogenase maturation protease
MSSGDRPTVLVAAIGNPDRGDDGVGPAVAARLRGRVPVGVRVLERSGDVLALIEEWDKLSDVFVIDAASPTDQPGRIYRLDLTGQPLPVSCASASTHAFGVAEAVELGRSLGRLPRRLVTYLIEGKQFDVGAPLSPAVAEAVDTVAERILAEIACYRRCGA